MMLFYKKFLLLIGIFSIFILSCNAADKIIIADYIYIETSSIKKIKKNNGEIIYSYIKKINKDKNNKYKIPFFDDKDDNYNKQTETIGYDIKTNCKKRTMTIDKIYLYNKNNEIIKQLNIKSRHSGYVSLVKKNTLENEEYKILCEYRNKGFFRKSDEF